MFQHSSTQGSLWKSPFQMPEKKWARLEQTWAQDFRERSLLLIDENLFCPLYCEDNGAPCKSIRLVVTTLIWQLLFDLTDVEAQAALDFDLWWHLALGVDPCNDDEVISVRTLQYLRAKLLDHVMVLDLFVESTEKLKAGLGLNTYHQWMDSTYLRSGLPGELSPVCGHQRHKQRTETRPRGGITAAAWGGPGGIGASVAGDRL